MKTTFTTISGNTFTTNEQGNYFYMIDTEGKKIRIKKAEFEAAQREDALEKLNREQIEKNEFVNISEEDIESKIAEIEESATTEELEEIQRKMAQEKTEEDAEDTQNTEAPAPASDAKKTPKKAKKNTRKKKVQVGGFEFQEGEVHLILTPKQVDFIKRLPDTCFWERGVESCIWVDCLCDEIDGQFAAKPMTVGAMISTLCEKGLGMRAKGKVNGKTATSFALTELGQKIAIQLGLRVSAG
jgi:hypothetical protein